MNSDRRQQDSAARRRKYVVHLSCGIGGLGESCGYIVRIHRWGARGAVGAQASERSFEDDHQLIAAINPLLPAGSDVRDVFGLVESPNGFFYLLRLTTEQARQLGWEG